MGLKRRQSEPVKALLPPSNRDRLTAYLIELDTLVREIEMAWGVGRLPTLVSPETLLRFKKANRLLNRAIEAGDPEGMDKVTAMMIRAWEALKQEAIDRGNGPLRVNQWETAMADGRVLVLVRTQAEAAAVAGDGREVVVFTMEELARLMPTFETMVACKLAFPGAKVGKVHTRSEGFAQSFATEDEFHEIAHGEELAA